MESYIIIFLLSIPLTIFVGGLRTLIETKLIESQIARLKQQMLEHRILAQRYEVEINRKQGELVKLQNHQRMSTSVGNTQQCATGT